MSEQEQIPGIEFGEACDFIIKLGKSAHVYGSTAGRLEVYLTRMTAALGFRGLAAMATGQIAAGEQQFAQMFVVALTIAAGLLIGNTIIQPKATL